jgi:hypothetical protein
LLHFATNFTPLSLRFARRTVEFVVLAFSRMAIAAEAAEGDVASSAETDVSCIYERQVLLCCARRLI